MSRDHNPHEIIIVFYCFLFITKLDQQIFWKRSRLLFKTPLLFDHCLKNSPDMKFLGSLPDSFREI